MVNIGPRIELVEFTDSCERFISYSSTGDIAVWSIKNKVFEEKIGKLNQNDMPLT
jgi:hypothetical protein